MTTKIYEIKNFQVDDAISAIDEKGVFEGYASVFNSVDMIGDTIAPNAFDEVLTKNTMPAMFYDHDHWELPIGKWLDIHSDIKGLFVKGQLDLEDETANKIYKKMKFGAIKGLSIGFTIDRKGIENTKDGRLIQKVKSLYEISIVSMPCEQQAVIGTVKNLNEVKTVRDFENSLRDLGLSQSKALAVIAKAKSLFGGVQGELEDNEKAQKDLQCIAHKLNNLSSILKGV